MPSLAALDRRTPEMRWREARDESSLWGDLRPELAGAVSQILHATMEDELAALLVARPYERSLDRAGYRNGRFRRWLATEFGCDRALCAPGSRAALSPLLFGAGRPTHEHRRRTAADGLPARPLDP